LSGLSGHQSGLKICLIVHILRAYRQAFGFGSHWFAASRSIPQRFDHSKKSQCTGKIKAYYPRQIVILKTIFTFYERFSLGIKNVSLMPH
jgi:hypothetical protein